MQGNIKFSYLKVSDMNAKNAPKINRKRFSIITNFNIFYTLNLKCMMSPSFTMYSLPSTESFPASFTFASEP